MNKWGGAREGAGRPKENETIRKQRQLRAFDEEWELIKMFAKITRKDFNNAKKILDDIGGIENEKRS